MTLQRAPAAVAVERRAQQRVAGLQEPAVISEDLMAPSERHRLGYGGALESGDEVGDGPRETHHDKSQLAHVQI